MFYKILSAVTLGSLLLASAPAWAGSASGSYGGATFISNTNGGNGNSGGCDYMVVGVAGNGAIGAVRFTINYPTFGLRNRASVSSATMKMTAGTAFPSGGVGKATGSYSLDRLNIQFNGSFSTTFNVGGACTAFRTGSSGGHAGGWLEGGSCGGGATWNSPFCNGTGWSLATSNSASFSRQGSNPNLWWDVTNDVQAAINAGASEIGWRINYVNDATAGTPAENFSHSGSLAFSYSCINGTVATGTFPFFNSCTTCNSTATGNCVTSVSGNSCVDPGAPSLSYSCSCGANGWQAATGGQSCVPDCNSGGTTCKDNDSGASCNHIAGSHYTCTCSSGFVYNGTTCVQGCNAASPTGQPCGNGGTCHTTNGGVNWTCTCPSGYKPGGPANNQTCIEYDGCFDNVGNSSCLISVSSNTCSDLPASTSPTGWKCSCGNPAYTGNTASNPTACVNKDECLPKHCSLDGGDSLATCTDHPAPDIGYDCHCNSDLFEIATVAGNETCVDKNECASPSPFPCLHGDCTNIDAAGGGGYACACEPGFVSTGGKTPVCVHPDSCSGSAGVSCVTDQKGNTCVDNPPPAIAYHCECNNPAYTVSVDGRSCIDKNGCAINHCSDDGDNNATCTDRKAPKADYDCACDPGFEFDGTTCADINECASGSNPCAHGSCNNTKGGYTCTCALGYQLKSKSGPPTCVQSGGLNNVTYTATPGSYCGCRVGGRTPIDGAPIVLFCGIVLLLIRRRQRTSR